MRISSLQATRTDDIALQPISNGGLKEEEEEEEGPILIPSIIIPDGDGEGGDLDANEWDDGEQRANDELFSLTLPQDFDALGTLIDGDRSTDDDEASLLSSWTNKGRSNYR